MNDLKFWIAFSYLPEIGSSRFRKLLNYFKNLELAWKANINEFKEAGKHKVEFSGDRFGSGIYFYTIKAAGFSKTLKMMLLK